MDKINKTFLEKVAIYDLFLSLLFVGVSYFFIKFSAFFFLIGISFALINLIVNSVVTNVVLSKKFFNKTIITILSSLFRILLICIPGIVIIFYSKLNFFLYIIGYTSQMISLVLYGLSLKDS